MFCVLKRTISLGLDVTKRVFEISAKERLKPAYSATEISCKTDIPPVAKV